MVEITINGTSVHIEDAEIFYDLVVRLAGMSGHPTITYRRGDRPDGILSPGGRVKVKAGMIFNVAHTGDA